MWELLASRTSCNSSLFRGQLRMVCDIISYHSFLERHHITYPLLFHWRRQWNRGTSSNAGPWSWAALWGWWGRHILKHCDLGLSHKYSMIFSTLEVFFSLNYTDSITSKLHCTVSHVFPWLFGKMYGTMAIWFKDKQCPRHGGWMNKNVPFFICTPLKMTAIQTVKIFVGTFWKIWPRGPNFVGFFEEKSKCPYSKIRHP